MKRLIVFLAKLVGFLFIGCGLFFAVLAVIWSEHNFIYGVVGVITFALGVCIVIAKKGYLSNSRYGYLDESIKKTCLEKGSESASNFPLSGGIASGYAFIDKYIVSYDAVCAMEISKFAKYLVGKGFDLNDL